MPDRSRTSSWARRSKRAAVSAAVAVTSSIEFSRPRGPVFGRLYSFYFRRVLPRVGQLVSRSKENAYTYLPESALRFPDYEVLAAKLRDHGLVDVTFTPFTLGIATLYVGVKPSPPTP